MQKATRFFLLIFFTVNCCAQDAAIRNLQTESLRTIKKDIPDSSKKNWHGGAIYSISAGQGSQSNWAAGGDDFSLTLSTSLTLFCFLKKEKHSWDNTADINFGYINTTSLGSRKNDDRFDVISKYGFTLNPKLSLATLLNLRSQFLNGYTYKEGNKNFTSAFLSPAYFLVSQGLDYKPGKDFSLFLSPVTSRWVIVKDDSLSARGEYGVPPGEHSLNQLGAFATLRYQKSFNKYVSYKGRLDVFSNYQKNPLRADLYMTNMLSAKVAKIIAFSWNVDMIYDDDVKLFGKTQSSAALQLKSIIGVGLQVKI